MYAEEDAYIVFGNFVDKGKLISVRTEEVVSFLIIVLWVLAFGLWVNGEMNFGLFFERNGNFGKYMIFLFIYWSEFWKTHDLEHKIRIFSLFIYLLVLKRTVFPHKMNKMNFKHVHHEYDVPIEYLLA